MTQTPITTDVERTYRAAVAAFKAVLRRYDEDPTTDVDAELGDAWADAVRQHGVVWAPSAGITMALSEAAAGLLNEGIRDVGVTPAQFPGWNHGLTERLATALANPRSIFSELAALRTDWVIVRLNVADLVAYQWNSPTRPENAVKPFPLVAESMHGAEHQDIVDVYRQAYNLYADAFSSNVHESAATILEPTTRVHVTSEVDPCQMERDPEAFHHNPHLIDGARFSPDMLATHLWEQAHTATPLPTQQAVVLSNT